MKSDMLRGGVEKLNPASATCCLLSIISRMLQVPFFLHPFEEAAILTIDGLAEWLHTVIGLRQSGIRLLFFDELHFPHSLGRCILHYMAIAGSGVPVGSINS
ncbi:MAG: hypothetical protein U0T82_13570 [Bacteroidales bacterium]